MFAIPDTAKNKPNELKKTNENVDSKDHVLAQELSGRVKLS